MKVIPTHFLSRQFPEALFLMLTYWSSLCIVYTCTYCLKNVEKTRNNEFGQLSRTMRLNCCAYKFMHTFIQKQRVCQISRICHRQPCPRAWKTCPKNVCLRLKIHAVNISRILKNMGPYGIDSLPFYQPLSAHQSQRKAAARSCSKKFKTYNSLTIDCKGAHYIKAECPVIFWVSGKYIAET